MTGRQRREFYPALDKNLGRTDQERVGRPFYEAGKSCIDLVAGVCGQDLYTWFTS
jgi:hypothetical protein